MTRHFYKKRVRDLSFPGEEAFAFQAPAERREQRAEELGLQQFFAKLTDRRWLRDGVGPSDVKEAVNLKS